MAPLITIVGTPNGNDTTGTIDVQFSAHVTAASFNPARFQDNALSVAALSVSQLAADTLRYTNLAGWGGGQITDGDGYTYSDTVAGVATPQSGIIAV